MDNYELGLWLLIREELRPTSNRNSPPKNGSIRSSQYYDRLYHHFYAFETMNTIPSPPHTNVTPSPSKAIPTPPDTIARQGHVVRLHTHTGPSSGKVQDDTSEDVNSPTTISDESDDDDGAENIKQGFSPPVLILAWIKVKLLCFFAKAVDPGIVYRTIPVL